MTTSKDQALELLEATIEQRRKERSRNQFFENFSTTWKLLEQMNKRLDLLIEIERYKLSGGHAKEAFLIKHHEIQKGDK